tara:strand:+ start:5341 stop:6084 length:744 start_codon:yes stop_codon:yes gene_type:complete
MLAPLCKIKLVMSDLVQPKIMSKHNHKKKYQDNFQRLTQKLDRKLYKNKDFVVVSNNCWGAEIYKRLGLAYNTPFVGLFIFAPDYIKLLEQFDSYINCELSFVKESKWSNATILYPIGLLNDIEIHFMHYKDNEEALSKWLRRVNRMKQIIDKDKYFFKICDRDFADSNILKQFHKLPYKNKISFGISDLDYKNHFKIEENEDHKTVPDGIKLYQFSYKYMDVLKWVNSGKVCINIYSKLKCYYKVV